MTSVSVVGAYRSPARANEVVQHRLVCACQSVGPPGLSGYGTAITRTRLSIMIKLLGPPGQRCCRADPGPSGDQGDFADQDRDELTPSLLSRRSRLTGLLAY